MSIAGNSITVASWKYLFKPILDASHYHMPKVINTKWNLMFTSEIQKAYLKSAYFMRLYYQTADFPKG